MKLYEITQELSQAIELYNSVESDEDLLKVEKVLGDLTLSLKDKALAVGHHIVNVRSDVNQLEAEIARLTLIRDRLKKSEDWFTGYLKANMDAVGETKIDGTTVKLSIKNNPASVNITDESKIPPAYIVEKIVKSIDKKAIKASWDAGVGVDGTEVIRKTRLEIK